MKQEVILYGGGGHAKVVAECSKAANMLVVGFMDDDPSARLFEYSHLGQYRSDIFSVMPMVIAIGNNRIRKKISEHVRHNFFNAVHPSVLISESSEIGIGCMVLHRAIIQSGSIIGNHVIVNTAAQIDHDGVLEDYVHIGPGAIICGNVTISEGTLIGAGSVILQGVKIGKWSTIGAGSVVTRDVPDNALVMGVPAVGK